MAWTEPITDRTATAWHTLTDQNRIAGNLDWLVTELSAHELYSGRTVDKVVYTYNDYISANDWSNLLAVLIDLLTATSLEQSETVTNDMTWQNMNAVESLTLAVYNKYQLLLSQANNNHFAGDGSHSANDTSAIYAGGLIL